MNRVLLRVSIALLFVSVVFFLAALQIPHIGEGAPEWHTVKRPRIPAPVSSGEQSSQHPDIDLTVYKTVCLEGYRTKKVKVSVKAFWIDTLSCYCYFDDYGRLCAVPEHR